MSEILEGNYWLLCTLLFASYIHLLYTVLTGVKMPYKPDFGYQSDIIASFDTVSQPACCGNPPAISMGAYQKAYKVGEGYHAAIGHVCFIF